MTTVMPEKFVLEQLADGAIMLDLDAGILFRLNLTAAFVWQRALAGADTDSMVAAFADKFHVSKAVAGTDVAASLAPPQDGAGWVLETETHYEHSGGDQYRFSVKGRPVLEIATSNRCLKLRLANELTSSELYFHLKAVSPKLVALLGSPVLHASAVLRRDGSLMAFLGASGAGKTTTARAFAAAGLRLICEDKLVLRPDEGRMVGVLEGEPRIDAWIADTSARLRAAGVSRWCDVESVNETVLGPTARLGALVVLEPTRRRGDAIQLERTGPAEAAGQVFRHAFYGSFAAAEWRRYVGVAADVARATPTHAATVPNGSEQLIQAARRYIENTQS